MPIGTELGTEELDEFDRLGSQLETGFERSFAAMVALIVFSVSAMLGYPRAGVIVLLFGTVASFVFIHVRWRRKLKSVERLTENVFSDLLECESARATVQEHAGLDWGIIAELIRAKSAGTFGRQSRVLTSSGLDDAAEMCVFVELLQQRTDSELFRAILSLASVSTSGLETVLTHVGRQTENESARTTAPA